MHTPIDRCQTKASFCALSIRIFVFVLAVSFLTSSCHASGESASQFLERVTAGPSTSEYNVEALGESYENIFLPMMLDRRSDTTLLSPCSLWQMGSLLYLGARGQTQDELLPLVPQARISEDALMHAIEQTKAYSAYVQTATGLFTRSDLGFREEYLTDVHEAFSKVKLASVPFETNPSEAVRRINRWIAKQTNNKLEDAIHDTDIDQGTVSMLISTLLFKAKWLHPFEVSATSKRPFFSIHGDSSPCNMMRQEARLKFYSENGWSYVALPYLNEDSSSEVEFVFEAVLPPQSMYGAPVNAIESAYKQFIDTARKSAELSFVDISMPRLSLKNRVELNDFLHNIGVRQAFTDEADFSRMSETPLAIQHVIQETAVDITEAGTEISSMTSASMRVVSSLVPPPENTIVLDRPFFAVVREEKSEFPILFSYIASIN